MDERFYNQDYIRILFPWFYSHLLDEVKKEGFECNPSDILMDMEKKKIKIHFNNECISKGFRVDNNNKPYRIIH